MLKGDQVPSKGSLCAQAHVGKGETGWWSQTSACFSGCLRLSPPTSGTGVTGRRQKGSGHRYRQGWDRHTQRGVEAGVQLRACESRGCPCGMTCSMGNRGERGSQAPSPGDTSRLLGSLLVGWEALRSPRRNPWPLAGPVHRARPKLDSGSNCSCWNGLWTLTIQGTWSESCLIPLLSLGLQGPPSSTLNPARQQQRQDSFPASVSALATGALAQSAQEQFLLQELGRHVT